MLYRVCTAGLVLVVAAIASSCASADAPDTTATTAAAPTTATASTAEPTTTEAAPAEEPTEEPAAITLTDVYDNEVAQAGAAQSGLKGDWGFSCLVQGYDKTVLFDTGAGGRLLLANCQILGVDTSEIDVVVLSHEHGDHTGGLADVLELNPDVTVYCPASFSAGATASVEQAGATVVRVSEPVSVCPGVTVTAPLPGGSVTELGLLLETGDGPVLLTGCAHPGIVEMVEAATALAGEPLLAVLGGFHLYQKSDRQVDAVIADLKELGVRQCGPSHCTGARAIARFTEAFGSDYIRMGVGAVVRF